MKVNINMLLITNKQIISYKYLLLFVFSRTLSPDLSKVEETNFAISKFN